MAYNQDNDYLMIVKVDNQCNIKLININQCNYVNSLADNLKSSSSSSPSPSSSSCSLTPSKQLDNKQCELINLIRSQLKLWINSLGVQSAEAQNLKEPITCHTRFIQGSFRSNSPLKHNDSIYFLVHHQSVNHQPSTTITNNDNSSDENNRIQLNAIGLIRVGFRNLFLQQSEQLVNVNRCFSILGKSNFR